METYISISYMVYDNNPEWNDGRLVMICKQTKLDLHLDISYEQARKEMAKLMLRTGEKPHAVGKSDETDSTMYVLSVFLN